MNLGRGQMRVVLEDFVHRAPLFVLQAMRRTPMRVPLRIGLFSCVSIFCSIYGCGSLLAATFLATFVLILNPRIRIEFARFDPNLCGFPTLTSFTHWVKSQRRARACHYWTKLHVGSSYPWIWVLISMGPFESPDLPENINTNHFVRVGAAGSSSRVSLFRKNDVPLAISQNFLDSLLVQVR